MIDVNKITSTLAKLPDTQLQQYAQMHKTDPYIMALAMSESNRRKVVRSAGQGAQGMQAQPKVVDSEIAQMAPQPAQAMPEDQGIGQLPAGNMNFAGGGIIAFADGGDVERYQYGGTIYDPVTGVPISAENVSSNDLTMLESLGIFNPENRRALEKAERAVAQKPSTVPYGRATMPAAGYARPGMVNDPRMLTPPAPTPPPAPTARAATPGVAMPSYAGLDPAAMFRKEMELAGKQPHPQAKELEDIGAMKVKAKEEEVTGIEAIQQKFDNIFKGRKERMDTKETEIAKMGDQSLGLALLQAGAAMMTTPGGVGVALGKGIDVGSKQYVAGLDKLNAAKDKLSDARDRLEEVEAQRGELSARELFKARNEVKNAQIGAKDDMVKALMQRDNINRETALKMVDGQIKIGLSQLEQQGATARTGAQIASSERIAKMPSAQMQMITQLGGGDFNKGYEIYKQEGAVPKLYESYTKMLADPMKGAEFQAKYPTFETYMAGSGMMGGGKSGILDIPDAAAAGPVRPR